MICCHEGLLLWKERDKIQSGKFKEDCNSFISMRFHPLSILFIIFLLIFNTLSLLLCTQRIHALCEGLNGRTIFSFRPLHRSPFVHVSIRNVLEYERSLLLMEQDVYDVP